MNILFDPNKDVSNLSKHGVSLADAGEAEWDLCVYKLDTRKEYGERRQIGFCPIGERLYCVVFVDRENTRRIISLRKANLREYRYHVQTIESHTADA